MEDDRDIDELARALLKRLRSDAGRELPTGGIRRLAKTARAALGCGLGMLGGKLRGRGGEGLSGLDLERIERLVASLGELKGLAMKAGQMLGYLDPSMPEEVRALLALLQTQSQPMAPECLQQILRDELGVRAEALYAGLEPEPCSVASIGQVHRAMLPDGTQVAVKVLHPGMAEAIQADFRSARIGPAVTRLFAPGGAATVRDFMAEARARMLEECDYALEAERQSVFGRMLADHPVLVVPAVCPDWSSSRVLTSVWEPGQGLEAFLATGPDQPARDRFGRALFELYFGSLYRTGWFHADPHPGNYAFRDDGRLVVYDFGCVRRFSAQTVGGFVGLARAVAADDRSAIERALEILGARPPAREPDYQVIRSLLRGFYGPLLSAGVRPIDARISGEAREIMRSKLALMRIRLPGKFLFLFRIRFGLYAVLARLGARCDWRKLELDLAEARRRDPEGPM
ncbi:MAG: AarF/ABC1/UbiB kinase family protein [Deltaproteobacteria bacterium]|nr:AarF/ABC1/UbiB kinase family protein [Deltaproteobacteria bacterium]